MLIGTALLYCGGAAILLSFIFSFLMFKHIDKEKRESSKYAPFLNKGGWALIEEGALLPKGIEFKRKSIRFFRYGIYIGIAGLLINIAYLTLESF